MYITIHLFTLIQILLMKNFLILSFILCSIWNSNASTTLSICDQIDENKECVNINSRFELPDNLTDKKTVYFLYKNDEGLNTSKITMKLYIVNADGRESLDNTFENNIETDWTWFRQALNFSLPAKFKLYSYDASGNLFNTQTFEIYRKVTEYVGVGLKLKKDSASGYVRVWGLLEEIYKDDITKIFKEYDVLEPGDLITGIEGKNTTAMTLEEAISALRGNGIAGSTVKVSGLDLDGKKKEVTLTRRNLKITAASKYIEYYLTSPAGDACTVVNKILDDYINKFKNYRGPELPPAGFSFTTDYYSTIMPDNGLEAKIYGGGQPSWSCTMFENFEEKSAYDYYLNLAKELSACRFKNITFVSNTDNDNEMIRTTYFLPFGFPNPIPEGYENVLIEIKWMSFPHIDFDHPERKNEYSVTINVSTLK